ncbi:hypothetical protein F3Y22_tig00110597pilonHSYRG00869 [Hibiscus syriacus]|uniref:Uncharacterized protein n=1 Tax=Hibiscus syriacus TaxID=106335 RepID=A0A6A3A3M9_HIBSY|nr:hypothetical protein F3Y22_tig00110597pilonHSYRG00869 [Hibiscus syriacus]
MQHVDSDNNSSDYEVIFQDDFIDIEKLTDFICAAQISKVADALLLVEDRNPLCNDPNYKKRLNSSYDFWERNKQKKLEKKLLNEDDHAVHLSIPIIGSGVLTEPDQITQRTLPEDAIGSSKLTERICKALEVYDDEPPSSVHKYILDECRKWNLVWVGRNKVAPFEPDEVEMLLEVALYCLGIPLKTNVQELNDDRLEQLMSRFGGFDLVVGHNGYNPDKENNRHGRGSNDASRLEPVSQYNQSADGGLVHSHNIP